ELEALDDRREVLEPDEVQRAAARGDVGEAIVQGEEKGHAHDQRDVDHSRGDHHHPETPRPVGEGGKPAGSSRRRRVCFRHRCVVISWTRRVSALTPRQTRRKAPAVGSLPFPYVRSTRAPTPCPFPSTCRRCVCTERPPP